MSFSLNTNITSLQAQNNLRASSDFQSKTINRVTSGLRIVNSGDDASGLAIANGFRSDQAVLTQGIRNANDGLSTLQTIDGGMNNISMLLDRARTLAAQSASGTFAGDRGNLNSEFTNVLQEIDRQSQAVGMNTGGEFAKSLTTFIGGGKDATGASSANSAAISNGTVSVNLSTSAVDTKALGLGTFKTAAPSDTTLGAIVAGGGSGVGFVFSGAGFSDTAAVTVTAATMTSAKSLTEVVAAINANIAVQSAVPANSAFKAANITASLTSDGNGIAFSSTNNQFSVVDDGGAGMAAAKNILGTTTTGGSVSAGGSQSSSLGFVTVAATDAQQLVFTTADANGNQVSAKVNLNVGDARTTALASINLALQTAGGNLAKLVAVNADGAGTGIKIMGSQNFQTFIGATTTGGTGVNDGAGVVAADQNHSVTSAVPAGAAAGAVDISTVANAQQAVNALASAVATLGSAQAVVGKGENNFNYAMNLAQSQSTNLAAAESRIRDADLASEAANLTKAQILIQAGTAALAQANSAPQAILSLLK